MQALINLTECFSLIGTMVEVKDLDYKECGVYESNDQGSTIIATDGEVFALYERTKCITELSHEQATEIRKYRGLEAFNEVTNADMFMFGMGYKLVYKFV